MDAISSEACSMKSRVKTRPARHYIARWTPEEDAILLEHVMLHGTSQWGLLQRSNRLPLRDNKACCNRFILLKKKFIEQDGSSSVAHGAFLMGPDPVRPSAPGGGSLPPPPLELPPVGEPHHWSATATAYALHCSPSYHSLRSGNQQSLGSGNHPSRENYSNCVVTGMREGMRDDNLNHHHSHQHHLSAGPGGLLASSTTSPHSTSLNSLNSLDAYSFTAPPLPFPSAPSTHRSLLLDAMPPRKSSSRLVVELTGDWGFTAADAAASSAAAASAATACSDNSMNLSPHPSRTSLAPHHAAFAASAFPHAQHVTSSAVGLSPCPVPRTSLAVAVAALPGPGTLPVSPLGVAPPVASPRGAAPPGTPTLPRVHRHSASKAPPPRAAAADSASPAAASPAATPRIDRAKTAYAYDASSAAAAAAAAASSASAAAAYVSGGGVRGVDERERKRARMMGPCKEEAREETREEATTRLQSYGAVRLGSDDTEMSDETPVPPPPHHAQQQQQWYAMNLTGNTVPSSPVPPASPEVNPTSASPAPPAARLVDVEGVSVNVESDFCVRDAAFATGRDPAFAAAPDPALAGRNCADWPAERAGVADECREAHSSVVDTKKAPDSAASDTAATAAAAGLYAAGSVLVPDSELLACLNSLTSCLSWPDLTLLDTDVCIKIGGAGYPACMMGRSGLEMGEQIDGCVAPREDGEVLALRPDFLLDMMSSG